MLPKRFDLDTYKSILLRRKWYVIVPFCLVLCIGAIYAVIKPKLYKASTLILVERQKVPENYVRSTVTSDLSDRINTIRQQVTSRTNLESIINHFGLYKQKQADFGELTMQEKVELMREDITVQVHRGTAFSIDFVGVDPVKIAEVANKLASNFIDENLRVREDQSIGTTKFLESELSRIERILAEREAVLQGYIQKYMGGLPGDLDTNLRITDQLRQKVASIERSLDEARTQKIMLQQQISNLRNLAASLPTEQGDGLGSEDSMAAAPELQQLRDRLSSLRLRYTENHPDVVKVRKMIAKITEQQEAEEQVPGSDSYSPSEGVISSEGFDPFEGQVQGLEFQVTSIEQSIRSLQNEKARLDKQISLLDQRITDTPQRHLELISIQRNYDTIKDQYDSLMAKKLQSELAENMEKRQKGEQFRVIDPAKTPEKPFRPNVPKIMLAALLLGLGTGFGLALGIEYLDQSFRDYTDISEVLQIPVLAVIPRLQTAADVSRSKRLRVIGYCLSGCFLAALGVTIWLWVNGALLELVQKIREFV
jgi:polysaccharide chain length determinant protein (PEP-CTERM system associated)